MTYVTISPDKFDIDPLGSINSINIEGPKNTAEQVREEFKQRLEEHINSQHPNKVVAAKFAETTYLVAQATATDDLSEKAQKFHEASKLALEIANKGYGNYPSEVYEVIRDYALLISGNEEFTKAFHALELAKEARIKKDLSQQYIKCTDAFESLTNIVTFCWRLYPRDVHTALDFSVREMLTSEAFEQIINKRGLKFEVSLRLRMLWPSVKNCKDLVSNYRKTRKNFIYSVLRAVKIYTSLDYCQIPGNQTRRNPLSPFLKHIGVKTDEQVQVNQHAESNESPDRLIETVIEKLNNEFEYEKNEAELVSKKNALASVIERAIQETTELVAAGFDITDPSVVTPLGWTANEYPEIAEQCNQAIAKIAEWQRQNLKWQNTEIASSDEW